MKNAAVLTEDGAFARCFRTHRGEFDSSRVTTPGKLPSKAKKKKANSRGISGDAGAAGIDWCINVKVESGSTFTFTRDLSYIAFIYLSA